jgi:hypothetical protein
MEEASAHLIINPEEMARKQERNWIRRLMASIRRHIAELLAELLQEMNISSIHYLIEVIAVSISRTRRAASPISMEARITSPAA